MFKLAITDEYPSDFCTELGQRASIDRAATLEVAHGACGQVCRWLPGQPQGLRPYRFVRLQASEEYISYGWNECLQVLDRLEQALQVMDRTTDPCLQTGAGWIAEEALATGLLCFLLYPEDPVAAIRRAAVSSGDSDSIACLTGAFAGAYHGLSAWPAEWVTRIEYRAQLSRLGEAWDR